MPYHIDKIINSAGLLSDIIGAWFIAWEVVSQFTDAKYKKKELQYGSKIQAVESESFIQWEKKKYCRMKIGLAFLTAGFLLQIASNWISLF